MPDVNQPNLRAWISWTTNPLDAPVFTGTADITSYLLDEGFSIRRGRKDKTAPVAAGRLTLTVLNTDRRFDPEYTAGAYYPNVKPMKRIQVNMQWPTGGTHYVLFSGFVESFRPDYDIYGRSVCRITAIDALGTFFARQVIGGETIVSALPARPTTWVQVGSGLGLVVDTVDLVDLSMPRPGARKVRVAFPGTVQTSVGLTVLVDGTNTSGVFTSQSFMLLSGVANQSFITTNAFRSINRLSVAPITSGGSFNAADVGQPFLITIDSVFPSELSSSAMGSLLNASRWGASERSIQTGVSTIQSYTVSGGSLLNYVQAIADTEGGVAFIDRTGLFVFKNRHDQILATSTATFGDGGGAELPYGELTLDYGDQYIYTQVRGQRVGGTEQVAEDPTASNAYFSRIYPTRGQTLDVNDNEVRARVQWLLARHKDPRTVVSSLKHVGEKSAAALWPVLLAGELQQLYTIIRRPPVGSAITQLAVLESIAITMNAAHEIRFEWGFSEGISGTTYLIVDDPIYGQVDNNAVAY